MRDIGKNIRDLRERSGLTQEALAEKLFVTRQTVSNYETGKTRPDLDMLLRIAEAMDTDANTVLYGIPQPPERKRTIKRLAITGSILLVLFVAVLILYPIGKDLASHYGNAALNYFLGWVVIPGLWALGGFYFMEVTKFALIPQLRTISGAKWFRLAILGIWGLCLLLLVPYGVQILIAHIRVQATGAVHMSYSLGKILNWVSYHVMNLARHASPIFSLSGILYSLLIPQQEPK